MNQHEVLRKIRQSCGEVRPVGAATAGKLAQRTKSPPSVLIAIPSLAGGGAENVVVTLLNHLDRTRIDPTLVLLRVDDHHGRLVNRLPQDVDPIVLSENRLRHAIFAIWRLIRRSKPDIVFSTLDHMNIALALLRPALPRGSKLIVRATDLAILDNSALTAAMRIGYRLVDGIIFQSDAMENAYAERLGFRHAHSRVIRNPVQLARIRALASSPSPGNTATSAINLVAAGRMAPEKGFDILLKAIQLLQRDDVSLTVLGEGRDIRQRIAQSEELGLSGRVKFVGFQDNPYCFYARADGFVLSSRSEGFPNVVLEALACGTPVIATPVRGIRELLSREPNSIVVKDFSAEALAAGLSEFCSRPRRKAAPEVVAQFDASLVAAEYASYFEDVLAAAPQRGRAHE